MGKLSFACLNFPCCKVLNLLLLHPSLLLQICTITTTKIDASGVLFCLILATEDNKRNNNMCGYELLCNTSYSTYICLSDFLMNLPAQGVSPVPEGRSFWVNT